MPKIPSAMLLFLTAGGFSFSKLRANTVLAHVGAKDDFAVISGGILLL